MNLKFAKLQLLRLVSLLLIMTLAGCAPYKIPTNELCEESSVHWLYNYIPRHRSQIAWYDAGHWIMWGLLGNDDDGIFGEGLKAHYEPEKPPSLGKAMKWQIRNPLHNFCFYVIGSANRENSEFTLLKVTPFDFQLCHYEPTAHTVFPSKNSCFYLALHGGKPFISFRLRWTPTTTTDFYFGWRERGNFGIKATPLKKSTKSRESS